MEATLPTGSPAADGTDDAVPADAVTVEPVAEQNFLWARWIFLRALGVVFFSAFYSLVFQIEGLIGPQGILPAGPYIDAVRNSAGFDGLLILPSLFWISSSRLALGLVVGLGLIASVALILNLWPRMSIAVCGIAFLSFVAVAREFSGYQSDGMLLEAAFLSIFFAPPGLRPGFGQASPPSRLSLFMLRWEWFRIYFESGLVKLASGEVQWRNLTAMDHYYENAPLPTWIAWYVQHLPHWFHASTVVATLAIEMGVVLLLFLPRPFKLFAFAVTLPLQISIILTGNYAFLNYIVLALGFLLVDDGVFERLRLPRIAPTAPAREVGWKPTIPGFLLAWYFYSTIAVFLVAMLPGVLLAPAAFLEPFRIANRYGLFAIMTRERYELEYQGTTDGVHWVAYPFRYKPQDPEAAPGIYAPYQPRFEWNLWFASLDVWQGNPWVFEASGHLLRGDRDVLNLFASDPLRGRKPIAVRVMKWQYWFTTSAERRATGAWWRRQLIEQYGPTITPESLR